MPNKIRKDPPRVTNGLPNYQQATSARRESSETIRQTLKSEDIVQERDMDQVTQNILIGSILGDGHLDKSTRNGSRWILKYDDKYLQYLGWIRGLTSSLNPSPVKQKKNYHQHYFSSRPSPEIGMFRKIFYPVGIKSIPKDINILLNDPLSLAVWYMDDGSLDKRHKYHCNSTIATFCFDYEECVLLCEVLKNNFGIVAKVHKSTMRGKMQYRLYVVSGSMERFINLIRPYIQPCLKYKIAL